MDELGGRAWRGSAVRLHSRIRALLALLRGVRALCDCAGPDQFLRRLAEPGPQRAGGFPALTHLAEVRPG